MLDIIVYTSILVFFYVRVVFRQTLITEIRSSTASARILSPIPRQMLSSILMFASLFHCCLLGLIMISHSNRTQTSQRQQTKTITINRCCIGSKAVSNRSGIKIVLSVLYTHSNTRLLRASVVVVVFACLRCARLARKHSEKLKTKVCSRVVRENANANAATTVPRSRVESACVQR